jgi:hypothetical protein
MELLSCLNDQDVRFVTDAVTPDSVLLLVDAIADQ